MHELSAAKRLLDWLEKNNGLIGSICLIALFCATTYVYLAFPQRFELNAIGERLDKIDNTLTLIHQNTSAINASQKIQDDRLSGMERRMDSIEGRMASMEGRMGSMERRLDSMDGRLLTISNGMAIQASDLSSVERTVRKHEAILMQWQSER